MSKDYNGSVAPKERINISYIPKTDGEPSEVELPLNMLIVGIPETHRKQRHLMNARWFLSTNIHSIQ